MTYFYCKNKQNYYKILIIIGRLKMQTLAKSSSMIYNVSHRGGESMNVAISKWGNSIGIRIPAVVTETLKLKPGDQVACELKDGGMFIRKNISTAQMFEQFYGKPFSKIDTADLGCAEEIDWGEDVGGEII